MEWGDHWVSEFPDSADWILEGAIAIDHDFDGLAGELLDLFLDFHDEWHAIAWEELDSVFVGFVGTK